MNKIYSLALFLCFLIFFKTSGYSQKDNDFRASLSLDPKMITVGPYEDSEKGELDVLLKAAYRIKNFEFGIFYEGFDAISYSAAGVNANYLFLLKDKKNRFDKWEIGVGPGFGVIVREELALRENYIEGNGELRYFFNKTIGLMFLGNVKYRSDLVVEYDEDNPWRYSNYWGVIFRW